MENARDAPINPDNFVKVEQFLAPGETLDLGCGSIERYDHRVDISEEYEPDTVWDLNETPLPFDDGAFDNVIAVHVLEHLEDDLAVLAEMKRIATERVVVVVPIGERPETDDHERELEHDEWVDRFDPDDTVLSAMGGYYDLVAVWRLSD